MTNSIFKVVIAFFFLFSNLAPIPSAQAHEPLNLPAPGTMVSLSTSYEPALIKGLVVSKDNPFLFDFIIDVGQDNLEGEELRKESEKLIKYFLASLAISEKDLWVNLSPYEKDRIIPSALGQTDMGRDLLAQDYILKQITASLIYPEKELGKSFWDKVYAKAQQMYGTTQIPINTFNKVWIMADHAEVFEHDQTAFVTGSHLKVMLEEDYQALQKHASSRSSNHSITSQIVREIILPELEKEVNSGKNFAKLRQITNSLILASWFKNNLKHALVNQIYANKEKVKGINLKDPGIMGKIYQRYLQAYKKGVFNYIKEENTGVEGQNFPRKYFSGGWDSAMAAKPTVFRVWPNALKFRTERLVRVATVFVAGKMAKISRVLLITYLVAGIYVRIKMFNRDHVVLRKEKPGLSRSIDRWIQKQEVKTDRYANQAIDYLSEKGKKISRVLFIAALVTNIYLHTKTFNWDHEALRKKKDRITRTLILPALISSIHFHSFNLGWDIDAVTKKREDIFAGTVLGPTVIGLLLMMIALNRNHLETVRVMEAIGHFPVQVVSTNNNVKRLGRFEGSEYVMVNVQGMSINAVKKSAGLGNDWHIVTQIEPKRKWVTQESSDNEDLNALQGYILRFSNPAVGSEIKVSSRDHAQSARGGIDLNDQNINWDIHKVGKGIEMNIDPAMIERIKREGIESLTPEIYNITPVVSIWSLINIQLPQRQAANG